MNISSTINNIMYELLAYYIDNQKPFKVTIRDRNNTIDLPIHLFSHNGEVISVDVVEWCLETASYDDKHLYVTYVLGSDEVPITVPFVDIIGVTDLVLSSLIIANPYAITYEDVVTTNNNKLLDTYIRNNRAGIEHSMSCLSLVKVNIKGH